MSLLLARRRSLLFPTAVVDDDAYAAEVLADNPTAWWRLSETAGSTAADEVGTVDLAVTGADLSQSIGLAQLGSGASFDGVDDHMSVNAVVLTATPFTVEAWVKGAALTGAVWSQGVSYETLGYIWMRVFNGHAYAQIRSLSPDGSVEGSITINDGNAHHIVTVFQSDSTIDIYVDGVLDASGSTGDMPAENDRISIGRLARFEADQPLNGLADEVAVYDGLALSPTRILAHYNAGVGA